MAFFEPPPPPPDPAEFTPQPWMGPPDNVLGVPVALRVVLARTADVVVAIVGVVAYPDGVRIGLELRSRARLDPMADPFLPYHRPPRSDGTLPDELFRFGVEYGDGARATTVDRPAPFVDTAAEPTGPVLMPCGGAGSERRWAVDHWLWPLPPPGPLALVCEWPARGIQLTRIQVDAGPIREAAAQAETLWDEGGPTAGGSMQISLGR